MASVVSQLVKASGRFGVTSVSRTVTATQINQLNVKQTRGMAYYEKGPFSGNEVFDNTLLRNSAITYELEKAQRASAESIVPWFFDNMPRSYFRHVDAEDINKHLRAMSALQVAGVGTMPSLTLSGDNEVTYIRSDDRTGLLRSFLRELSSSVISTEEPTPVQALKAFGSNDGKMVMDIFKFSRTPYNGETPAQKTGTEKIFKYVDRLMSGEFDGVPGHAERSPMFENEALEEYFNLCSADYISISDPRRFCLQREMYEAVNGTEEVSITTDENDAWGSGSHMVTVAATNMLPQRLLEGMTEHLEAFGINIKRAHVDVLMEPDGGPLAYDVPRKFVVMTRLLLNPTKALPSWDGEQYELADVLKGIARAKWIDPFVATVFKDHMSNLGVNCLQTAELISALINSSRGPLSKIDRYAYVGTRIQDHVLDEQHLPITIDIAQLLMKRFNPEDPMDEADFLQQAEDIKAVIQTKALDDHASTILNFFVDFVTHVQATNMFNGKRMGLAMKLDPHIMHATADDNRQVPYGVYYVHGRRFDGFHVRFRDIARGGLRMVTPTIRAYEAESCRHYDENYNLAFAQQLKNKDIPEGGSKGVVLIRPSMTVKPEILTRKCVKAYNDCLLDLIGGDDVQDLIVRRDGIKDTLYLGPDEQIIPEDIAWMTERAKQRNYFNGNAYISSKATNGINHKDYGVTSEGVNVFMEVALNRVLGINPKTTPFTVKLTGGPDGDVAGNMIKMNREYGDNVKVVAIADGFGAAEDPNGLDMTELLRLFKEARSIVDYNPALVDNETSFVHDASTSQGAFARNTMHNRVEADVFVPGGGRPETIGEGNYKAFLKEDGTPSSSLIVEGANLFLTPAARSLLFGHGAYAVKDSSANKCGVIVSSYEIISAMLMDEEEFVDNKEDIVEDVQDKIKELARLEAELLFDESDKDKTQQLPDLSLRISNAIIKVSDAVHKEIENADFSDFDDILHAHLPSKIAEIAFDRIHDRVPRPYLRNIIAKRLGTTLVYREGLAYAEQHEGSNLAKIAIQYGSAQRIMDELVSESESTDPEVEKAWKKKMMNLLKRGSPRLLID